MKYLLAFPLLIAALSVHAQDLNIDSYSYKQYILKDGVVKEYSDTTKVVINEKVFIKGKEQFKVVTILQSTKAPNKFRIYYMKPVSYGDFGFEIEKAEFDTNYNELKLRLSESNVYGLYIK